jgi:hypothetical protein
MAALVGGAAGVAWFAVGATGQRVRRTVTLVAGGVAASVAVIGLSHLWQAGDPQQWWWCLLAADVVAWFVVVSGTAVLAAPALRKARSR